MKGYDKNIKRQVDDDETKKLKKSFDNKWNNNNSASFCLGCRRIYIQMHG